MVKISMVDEFQMFNDSNDPQGDEIKSWVVAHSGGNVDEFKDLLDCIENSWHNLNITIDEDFEDFAADMRRITGISEDAFVAKIMRTEDSVADSHWDSDWKQKHSDFLYRLDFGGLDSFKDNFPWFKDELDDFFSSQEELGVFWEKVCKKSNIHIVFPIPYSNQIRMDATGGSEVVDEEDVYDVVDEDDGD